MLVLSTALSLTATSPAHALFGGGFSSAAIVAAVNKVKDSVLGGFNTLNLTNIMGFGQMTQNSQTEIAAEARMREAEQKLDLMRRIDEQKILARDRSANSRMDCIIETRSRYVPAPPTPDTKEALAKFAAIKLGMAVEGSGEPKKAETKEEKATQLANAVERKIPTLVNILTERHLIKDDDSTGGVGISDYLESCHMVAQLSDGTPRENIDSAESSKEADSGTKKVEIFSDFVRGSLAQKVILDYCAQNNFKDYKSKNPELHGTLLARAEELSNLQHIPGEVNAFEAREIKAKEWVGDPTQFDNLNDAAALKQIILVNGHQLVQNEEQQTSLDTMNVLLSAILMSVNEQTALTRTLLEN